MLSAIPAVLISFLTVPYDSTDAFVYIAIGQAESHYGMNPYTTVLRDLPASLHDPAIATGWMDANGNPWPDLPLVYGFAFALLIRALAWAGGGHFWIILGLIKCVNVVAYGFTIGILWKLSKTLGDPRPDIVVYLFACSPLILLHLIANAHNDILVGCLIAAGFYFLVQNRSIWALSALTVGALIKYISIPLVPLFVFAIAGRQGWRRALAGVAIAGIVAALFSMPFITSLAGFRFDLMASQLDKITAGSLHGFIFYVYRFLAPPSSVPAFGNVLKVLLWTVAGVGVARIGAGFFLRRKPSVENLLTACGSILFAIIFIGSSQFYSWYIGMLFPVALLLHSGHWLRRLMVLLNATHVFSLTSLNRKGIGYFVVTSGLALLGLRSRVLTPEQD